ncbi:Nacht and ankyrin domain protein [Fusarium beomiforme]|uniref:Nacht and ankyrin domain protein n=1 Tax=Fusarium beomiforme TaxID=44412 RepID=A0A9P5ANZ3_9HYPO|nr:Nacht and ankyrin domain protein [Fusarium beomiforme]
MPGKQIEGLFRDSRGLLPTPSLADALSIFFGLSGKDLEVFNHNRISKYESTVGFHTDHPDTSRRIMEHQKQDFAIYLQGKNLSLVMERFINNVESELSRVPRIGDDWVNIPDLFSFVSGLIFRANLEALYGEKILQVCPNFCQDFWAFYEGFPYISQGLPRWLAPSSYKARDKMHENFDTWRTWCDDNFDWNNQDLCNAEYEPVWGTQYIRRMVQRHKALGLSRSGVSAAMLGYLFFTMANTVPAAVWMVLHIILDDQLLDRVRSRILFACQQQLPNGRPHMRALMVDPLIKSIYHETLRLRVASTVGRTATNDKVCLAGGWRIRKGVPIMFAGWLAGLDEWFWNTGQQFPEGQSQHPLESFWAERFLTYPGDPGSGPTKTKMRPRGSSVKRQKLTLAGLRGHYFPFGGGAFRCPGESLAMQVIIVSVAMILQNLHINLSKPEEAGKTRSGHRKLHFGSHAFDKPVPVEVRRRIGN